MTTLPAAGLHADALVVDTHVHGPRFVPQPFRSLYRLANRSTMPPDVGFDVLAAAGVDAVVGAAVGDPVVTRWYGTGAWRAVLTQIDQLVAEIMSVGGSVALDVAAVRAAHTTGRPSLVLGLEGADAIGSDLDRLDELHRLGVRTIIPVHLGDNPIGTTSLPWQRYVGPLPVRRSRRLGLSSFGRSFVERANRLGIIVDVSHADRRTTLDGRRIGRSLDLGSRLPRWRVRRHWCGHVS